MSTDRHAARRRRSLEEAGFRLEVKPSGKRFWRTPETGEMISEDHAVSLVKDAEERALEAAGWEPENVEGSTYWRRPGSGRLCPREAAYDVLSAQERKARDEGRAS